MVTTDDSGNPEKNVHAKKAGEALTATVFLTIQSVDHRFLMIFKQYAKRTTHVQTFLSQAATLLYLAETEPNP